MACRKSVLMSAIEADDGCEMKGRVVCEDRREERESENRHEGHNSRVNAYVSTKSGDTHSQTCINVDKSLSRHSSLSLSIHRPSSTSSNWPIPIGAIPAPHTQPALTFSATQDEVSHIILALVAPCSLLDSVHTSVSAGGGGGGLFCCCCCSQPWWNVNSRISDNGCSRRCHYFFLSLFGLSRHINRPLCRFCFMVILHGCRASGFLLRCLLCCHIPSLYHSCSSSSMICGAYPFILCLPVSHMCVLSDRTLKWWLVQTSFLELWTDTCLPSRATAVT